MILPKIIREGQALIVWKKDGTRSIEIGPKTIYVPFAETSNLHKAIAKDGEYLVIEYKSGKTEHILGPVDQWIDPVDMVKVNTLKTIDVGPKEALAVFNDVDGKIDYRLILGPNNFMPVPTEWHEKVKKAKASEGEYLAIEHKDGRTEHKLGPCELWIERHKYDNVTTYKAIDLDAHEAIVVYNEHDGQVTHRVVNGPAIYVPKPTEWLHDFSWHGDDGDGKKRPHRLKFQKLRVIPDQMYFDVSGVRTADEALITVKLMVFFGLDDIEKMLKQTHDPIADFINALTADVIRYVGAFNFETFKEKAEALNDQATFNELIDGAERIGYTINKVVYRGYEASEKLQEMHDSAIEMRTQLVLEKETEEQQQELTGFKQDCEHERAKQERAEANRKQEHELEQGRSEREALLQAQSEEAELQLEINRNKNNAEKEHEAAMLDLRFKEWNQLQEAGANLTEILVAQEHNPDKTIRLEKGDNAQVHLHEAV